MKPTIVKASLLSLYVTTTLNSYATAMQPGLYEIQIETNMPNMYNQEWEPTHVKECLTESDIKSGRAYRGPRGTQYSNCELLDYKNLNNKITYHSVCPGPNAPSGHGTFAYTDNMFKGTVNMQMGGKNMTMVQKYTARRVADCK